MGAADCWWEDGFWAEGLKRAVKDAKGVQDPGVSVSLHVLTQPFLTSTVNCVDGSDLIGWGLNLECVGECSQFAVSYPSGGLVVLKLVWMQLEADAPQSLAEREE